MKKFLTILIVSAALGLSASATSAQETVTNLKVKRANPPADIFSTMRQFDAGQMMGGGATAEQAFVPDSLAGEKFLPPGLKPVQRAVKLKYRFL